MGNGYFRGILLGTGFKPVRENHPTRFQVKCVANMTLILYGGVKFKSNLAMEVQFLTWVSNVLAEAKFSF